MAMREQPVARDPLVGVELRQAARFTMTLVTEQAKVCQRLVRLVELGFPELGELFDDPACRTAREVAEQFETGLALILDGGPAPGGQPSTILDLTCDPPRILRRGLVPAFALGPFLSDLADRPQ